MRWPTRCVASAFRTSTCRLHLSAFGRRSRARAGRKSTANVHDRKTQAWLCAADRDRHVVVTVISTKTVGNYVSNGWTLGQQNFTVQEKTVQIKNWAGLFFDAARTCAKESGSAQCRHPKTSLCNDSFRALG